MPNISNNIINILCLSVFFILGYIAVSNAACSPGIPCTDYDVHNDIDVNKPKAGENGACDANFMNQIYSKAFLEASREVIMAEQLFHKPDSVLEYTCFDQYIAKSAHESDKIFSATQEWGTGARSIRGDEIETDTADDTFTGTEIINNAGGDGLADQEAYSQFEVDRLDNILADFLLDTLEEYIEGGFDHTFIGGATTIDHNLNTTSIGGNSYNCSHMSTVWEIARCFDFGEEDKFFTFEDLVGGDPRVLPEDSECSIKELSGGGGAAKLCPDEGDVESDVNTDFSNNIIRASNNCDTTAGVNAFSSFDLMKTHNDLIKGYGDHMRGSASSTASNVTMAGSATNVTCSEPLPTGVPVITYQYTSSVIFGVDTVDRTMEFHYDHLCPNPGCYYKPNKVPYTLGDALPASSSGECVKY